MTNTPVLPRGAFVRVKPTNEFRPGLDGMVVEPSQGTKVALMFGHDRYDRVQPTAAPTALVEEWDLSELDLASVEV